MSDDKKKLKLILESSFIHEVYLAKAKLIANGVESFIVDEHLNYTIGTAFIEKHKLMVDDLQFENAQTILSVSKT